MPKKFQRSKSVVTDGHRRVASTVILLTLVAGFLSLTISFTKVHLAEASTYAGIVMGVNLCFIMYVFSEQKNRLELLTSRFHYFTLLALSVLFILFYVDRVKNPEFMKGIPKDLITSLILALLVVIFRIRYLVKNVNLNAMYVFYFFSLFLFCSGLIFRSLFLLVPLLLTLTA